MARRKDEEPNLEVLAQIRRIDKSERRAAKTGSRLGKNKRRDQRKDSGIQRLDKINRFKPQIGAPFFF